MRRFMVLLAEIGLIILIVRSPFAQHFLNEMQYNLADTFYALERLPQQRLLQNLREDIENEMPHLKPYQREYLHSITLDSVHLSHFYRAYCAHNEINPNFFGQDRVTLCTKVAGAGLVSGT